MKHIAYSSVSYLCVISHNQSNSICYRVAFILNVQWTCHSHVGTRRYFSRSKDFVASQFKAVHWVLHFMYAIASQFLWIFLCPNVVEPHQLCTHHVVSQPALLWHSTMMGIQQRNSSSLPLSSKQFLYWTGQERVRYPTTANMPISDYHYCPKVSSDERRWVHW